jgi:hypothetical protein
LRFEIGESAADIDVLLATMRGRHAPNRSSVLITAAVALVVVAGILAGVRQAADVRTLEDYAVNLILLSLVVFVAVSVLDSLAHFEIDENRVVKTSPLGLRSWTIVRSDIHRITLELDRGWSLVITTTRSKNRRVPLDGSLRESLAKLYPEVAAYVPTPQDLRRRKWLTVALAAIAIAVAAMLWWLARRGLVSW